MKDERETVSRTAHCKRCGSDTVTWLTSTTTGKYYLAEVFTREIKLEGDDKAFTEEFTGRRWFHSKFCGTKPEYTHATMQRAFDEMFAQEDEEREEMRERQREEAAVNNAMNFLALVNAPTEERKAKLAKLEREQESYRRNPPTMDYMTEFSREVAAAKTRMREIAILKASLGMITDDDQ